MARRFHIPSEGTKWVLSRDHIVDVVFDCYRNGPLINKLKGLNLVTEELEPQVRWRPRIVKCLIPANTVFTVTRICMTQQASESSFNYSSITFKIEFKFGKKTVKGKLCLNTDQANQLEFVSDSFKII